MRMKTLFIVILLAGNAWAALPCNNSTANCTTGVSSVTYSGHTRYYDVFVPLGISTGYPVFVYLPGAGISCGGVAAGCTPYTTPTDVMTGQMQAFAIANQVMLLELFSACVDNTGSNVAPFSVCTAGTGTGSLLTAPQWIWRAGNLSTSFGFDWDDFGYISSMINTATTTWSGDASRVTLIGLSTGGIMAQQYAATFNSNSRKAINGLGIWAGTSVVDICFNDFQLGHAYTVGNQILPQSGNTAQNYFQAGNNGTSGTAPNWNTCNPNCVDGGTIVWNNQGPGLGAVCYNAEATPPTVDTTLGIPILLLQGDKDTTLPYCGKTGTQPWTQFPVMSTVSGDVAYSYWYSGMACTTSSTGTNACTGEGGTVNASFSTKQATGCRGSGTVLQVDYVGQQHTRVGPDNAGMCILWNLLYPSTPCKFGYSTPVGGM